MSDVQHYAVKDGVMICHGVNLFTAKEYANFILRFDFKLPPGGNNGVGIRSPLEGEPTFNGMEIQILDDGHEMYKGWLKPWQVHGSIYGVVAAKRGFLKPTGQWNQEEIVADGPHIKVTLNGTVITDADLSTIKRNGPCGSRVEAMSLFIHTAGPAIPPEFQKNGVSNPC